MNATQTIISSMRANLTADLAEENTEEALEAQDTIRRNKVRALQAGRCLTGERYGLASSKGRAASTLSAAVILEGTAIGNRNAAKRDASLPKRALSMASCRGRVTPDMASSLMAFFQNPGSLAHTLLCSFLPTKVSTADATALLSDPFVVDVLEGLGHKVPTALEAMRACKNPRTYTGRQGAARRLLIADGTTPTVDAKRRGRPSGPKYVAYLPFGAPAPLSGCEDTSGIPSSEDGIAAGAGHDQGAGWAEARIALTPAQVIRRDVAYTSSAKGYRTIDGVIVERW